jgi:hypothetical protein
MTRTRFALPLLALALTAAGCGGSSSGSVTVQPARTYRLVSHVTGHPRAGSPTTVSFRIEQPDGATLTEFRRGPGPHTGVHVIFVRRDLAVLVHHHPPIRANGSFDDTVDFPEPGPYRVVVDVYPQTSGPQTNFQLFSTLTVAGRYVPQRLPRLRTVQTVDGYRFTLHGRPRLRAIRPAFLSFTVSGPGGKPASFTPWYGALAHAIFFRQGSLDYFHTHVCAPGASGCTSVLGATRVTGTSATPGRLKVGVLVPVAGTWRLFLQCRVEGHVLTAPFTLQVR